MKNLLLIGGTMGVGKTTTGKILKKKLSNAVYLDGDWCWDADPFVVTDETKKMVMDNIAHLINNFLRCTSYENVIFTWVMHEQAIIDDILSGLTDKEIPFDVVVDRTEAIYHSLKMAEKGDIIVLAGKGHEDYQVLSGNEHIHFDEREIVSEGLKLID